MTSSRSKNSNLPLDEQDERGASSLNSPIPPLPSSKEPSPSSTSSSHPLEFITLTERPSSHKNDFSYTVRSHAMQSFLREKKNAKGDPMKLSSGSAKEHDQQTPKQLSGKFKLATWSRKPRTKKAKNTISRENSAESVLVKEEESYSEASLTPLEYCEPTYPGPIIDSHTLELLYHCLLPTVLCPLCQTTTYDSLLVKSNITGDPSNTTDSALLHSILCLASQKQDLYNGHHESPETLFHKGEAMMLMNRRLLDISHVINDADIIVVAIFVIIESMNGTFEAASAQRIGLLKMLRVQESGRQYKDNDTVTCVLAWSDIVFSTRFGLPTKFSHVLENIPLPFNVPSPPSYSSTSIFEDPNTASILDNLRYISSTIDQPNLSSSDKESITNTIYHTQCTLLNSPHLTNFQLHNHSPSSSPRLQGLKSTSSIEINLDNLSPTRILTTAFHITSLLYLQSIIPDHPDPTLLHKRLLSHLHTLMFHLSTITITTHQTQNQNQKQDVFLDIDPALPVSTDQDVDIVLWVLCTAISSTNDIDTKRSFMQILEDKLHTNGLNAVDLEISVRSVVWRHTINLECVLG